MEIMHVHAMHAAQNVTNGNPTRVITCPRRKSLRILNVVVGPELRLCPWKGQQYPIPEHLVGETFCRGRMWIVEVRQGQVHPAEFRFTDRETGVQGEWNKNPTVAFKSTYELTTGKILLPSFNGRVEVGVFSDAVRAILVALDIERLQAMNSPLVQHLNTMVTIQQKFHFDEALFNEMLEIDLDEVFQGNY